MAIQTSSGTVPETTLTSEEERKVRELREAVNALQETYLEGSGPIEWKPVHKVLQAWATADAAGLIPRVTA